MDPGTKRWADKITDTHICASNVAKHLFFIPPQTANGFCEGQSAHSKTRHCCTCAKSDIKSTKYVIKLWSVGWLQPVNLLVWPE